MKKLLLVLLHVGMKSLKRDTTKTVQVQKVEKAQVPYKMILGTSEGKEERKKSL